MLLPSFDEEFGRIADLGPIGSTFNPTVDGCIEEDDVKWEFYVVTTQRGPIVVCIDLSRPFGGQEAYILGRVRSLGYTPLGLPTRIVGILSVASFPLEDELKSLPEVV